MLYMRMLRDGGPVMVVILLCSLVALFVFCEKWFQFHREQINIRELVKGLINVLKRDGMMEAVTLCENTPGPVAKVLKEAILAHERGEEDIEQAIEDEKLVQIPALERHLDVLGTIGYIAPLLGLLGTVLGMMRAFQTIYSLREYLSAADLSGSISMALVTTAGGLCVAIPCYIAYNYLAARVNSMILEIEKSSSEILYFFKRRNNSSQNQSGVKNG
jgi:biopolymer transport protein ExbB